MLQFHCKFVVVQASEEITVTDGSKVFSPDAPIKLEAANARAVSVDCGDTMIGNMSALLPASQLKEESSELGCSASDVERDGKGCPFEHSDKNGNIFIESDGYLSRLPGGSLTTGQHKDAKADTLVLHSAKVVNHDSFFILMMFRFHTDSG